MSNKITVYCDGGGRNTTDRIGGVGILMEYKGVRKMFQAGYQDTTNNRTELLAVIHALSLVKNKKLPIEIYSDSAYVVNCFKDKWYVGWERMNRWKNSSGASVENKDLWQQALALYRSFENVNFNKVKGHSGVWGNCMCDQLATEIMYEVEQTNAPVAVRERLPDEHIHYELEFTKTGRIKKTK